MIFVPYKVDVPMARWPIANFILIGFTFLFSIAMFSPLNQWAESQQLNQIGLDTAYPAIVDYVLLQPHNFHISQLVGNLFIHEGVLHLVGNMMFLFVFGNAVNAKLGHAKFIAIYLVVGIVESTLWVLVGPGVPCLGASGAIMGIVGAFLLLYPLNDVSIAYWIFFMFMGVKEFSAMWVIAFYFAFDVWGLVSSGNSGVAYLAHVVGFLTGAAITSAFLKYNVVEMDHGEKSLLQHWGYMPHEETPLAPSSLLASTAPAKARRVSHGYVPPGYETANTPRAPTRRPPRDEGPIDLL